MPGPPVACYRIRMALRDSGRSLALLFARLAVAALFAYAGWKNLGQLDGTTAKLAAAGYPLPRVMAAVSAAALLGGGASVGLGALTNLGVVTLLLFLVPATWTFHVVPARAGSSVEIVRTLNNVALMGGLVLLWLSGPGPYSIDRHFKPGGRR